MRNSPLHKFATSRSFVPPSSPIFSLLRKLLSAIAGRSAREPSATGVRWESVHRSSTSAKSFSIHWRELDRRDRRNLVVCRPSRSLPLEEAAAWHAPVRQLPLSEMIWPRWISIRNPCYNVIVEFREGNCMTIRVYHDL